MVEVTRTPTTCPRLKSFWLKNNIKYIASNSIILQKTLTILINQTHEDEVVLVTTVLIVTCSVTSVILPIAVLTVIPSVSIITWGVTSGTTSAVTQSGKLIMSSP